MITHYRNLKGKIETKKVPGNPGTTNLSAGIGAVRLSWNLRTYQ